MDFEVIEQLRRDFGDDADVVITDLIDLFQTHTPELITRMREAVAAGDAGELRLAAHSLKGSSSYVGAVELNKLAAEIERIAKDSSTSCGSWLDRAEEEYAAARTALSAYLSALA
jgi:HPt (histidine-containing phosphotransfer) domain-containing protein